MIRAVNGIRLMRQLKNIIFKYPGKVDVAVEILNRLPDMKAITFAELTETAGKLAKRVPGSEVYHSSLVMLDLDGKKMPKAKAREVAIRRFSSSEVKRIHTARALDEGADFPEVSLGIRVSGSSSPTQQTQRRGRIVRKHEDKKAVMINLYLKNTKEVQWLTKSQSYSDDVIWVDTVDDLINLINV
jgi:superfamily II DNA or RNA helicase